jgi:DNA invertase Pin-like site-specific DNA recombinase
MPTPKRAVAYVRLSSSDDDSASLSTQRRDLYAVAERRNWTFVRVFEDDGISGTKSRVNADAALAMIRDGEADVLAVWKFDRWSRRGLSAVADLLEVLDVREKAGNPATFYADSDGLSSDQQGWRIIASVLSEVAKMESDNTKARVRAGIASRRAEDKWTGGAAIPFGYASQPHQSGRGRVLAPREDEAATVREVAARVLDGESTTAIARDLTSRGVATSKSDYRRGKGTDRGRWTASTIASLMTSDLLLGRVRQGGDVLRGDDGMPRSVWPPLLDVGTVEALRVRLRPGRPAQRRRTARLLSGIARCAGCRRPLYVTTSGGKAIYKCAAAWNGGGCTENPSINADRLEEYVSAEFVASWGRMRERVPVVHAEDPAASELAEVDTALQEVTSAMLRDDADVSRLAGQVQALKARRAALRATPAQTRVEYHLTGRTLAESWSGADVDARRDLLVQPIDAVWITGRAGSSAVAARVTITEHGGEVPDPWDDIDPSER